SEEHTSELQSHSDLVCRLLLEKKKADRKSTRLNSSHTVISYADFCLKKKGSDPGDSFGPTCRQRHVRGIRRCGAGKRAGFRRLEVSTWRGRLIFFKKRGDPRNPPSSPPRPPPN